MIKLPWGALYGMCDRRARIRDFEKHHGRKPGPQDTLADWWAVTPDVGDRLWAVAEALPRVYPLDLSLLKVVVRVAYMAAQRRFSSDEQFKTELEVLELWIDKNEVSAEQLSAVATSVTYVHGINCVSEAIMSAFYIANGDSSYGVLAAQRAVDRAIVGLDAEAIAGERERQRADIDELLAVVFGGAA